MDEKWSIDFKKFKKNSSKKLIKGGLGFFLSPRDEVKEGTNSGNFQTLAVKKSTNWNNEVFSLESSNSNEIVGREKDHIDDIPVIPSLDDFAEDDLTNHIISAPLISVKRVRSYKDLEIDLLRHTAFGSLEEVNLQVLIKLLHSESSLNEPDMPWTKDGLFNEMVAMFNEKL